MKEIDFLPDWYRQGRMQQRKHREFYIALGLIVFIMFVWSAFANGRVAIVKARNATLQNARLIQARSEEEYAVAETEYQQLKLKSDVLKSVGSRVVVSNILAELTNLLDGKVVLKKIEIKAEPFEYQDKQTGITAVAAGQSSPFEKTERFKIAVNGFAPDATEVAEIINRLEQSDYFFQIVPGYSRNVTVGEYQASEFEISCYLANYKRN
ncbi:MAG: PilN domain-containing protein [Phycisphaerae bacterium]|jgi:Tfp pilus assembly protein PilN